MSFLTFTYINVLGFILFIVYIIQLLSGILLSIYYNDYFLIAFDSIIYIVVNINNGFIIRVLHVIGASLFIVIIYLHLMRYLYYQLVIIYIRYITLKLIYTGYILFILGLVEGFIGYILCWGQMSYWGIIVMINIVAVIPVIGSSLIELIWSSAWVILNRIFIVHFSVGIVIMWIIILHILVLHIIGSQNPFIYNYSSLIYVFSIYIVKDIYVMKYIYIVVMLLLIEPDVLGNSDNNIIASPLITPNNILPEWYYLLYYSSLRSFPNKTIGLIIVLVVMMIILL